MAQVVPIKIKMGTETYSEWSQQHKHEGRGIPIVYIVRADGETLYAKSGKPKKETLGQMLTAALQDAGYIMTERDVSLIQKVTEDFRGKRESGDVESAIRSLRKAKKYLNRDGNVASFAESAVTLQRELDLLLSEATEAIEKAASTIKSANGDAEVVAAIAAFEETKAKYKPIKSLKNEFSEIQSTINSDKTMKSIQSALRTIRSAKSANTESKKARAITKLQSLIEEAESESIKTQAQDLLDNLKSK